MQRILVFTLCLLLLYIGTATSAQAGYLYVLISENGAGNRIYGFSVNEANGASTPLAGFPLNTGGTGALGFPTDQMTIDRTNNRLYAINDGSDTVSAYSINPATGDLTALPFSPIILAGSTFWTEVAVHPSGSPLFIGSFSGNSYSFKITAATANLAQDPFSLRTVADSSVFSRDGNFFYVGGLQSIASFSVNSTTGVLTPVSGSPFTVDGGPVGYSMDERGRFFLIEYANAKLRVFQQTDGVLTPSASNPFTGLSHSVKSVLHPNGNFLFIVSRDFNQVGSYQINGTGTATTLTPVSGSPFAGGGSSSNSLKINQAGTFLYTAGAVSRNLTTYSVNSTTGVLTNIAVQPENTLGTTGFVTGMDYIALPVVSVSFSGRVMTVTGKGISDAVVYFTDRSGHTRTARSNPFGYYRFAGVQAGETYTFGVRHKRFSFAQQTIVVTENLTNLNFTSEQ